MQGWNPRLTDRVWEGILRLHSQRPDARSLRSSQEAQPVPTQELLQHPFAGATGPGSLAAGPGRRPRFPDVQVTAFPTTRHSNSSQAPQEEASLRNRYVRGSLCFLPQVEWTPICPDSKECRVSLQWLKCRFIFHLTR